MNGMDDWLNPKSMLTPGIAGGITMMVATTLWCHFDVEPKWTGLASSFLLGLMVFKTEDVPHLQRAIYYVFNSLIIFSIGLGTGDIAHKFEKRKNSAVVRASIAEPLSVRPASIKPSYSPLPESDWRYSPAVFTPAACQKDAIILVQRPVPPIPAERRTPPPAGAPTPAPPPDPIIRATPEPTRQPPQPASSPTPPKPVFKRWLD